MGFCGNLMAQAVNTATSQSGGAMSIAIFYPVLAQVVLTLVVALGMILARNRALRHHDVAFDDIALDNRPWPTRCRQFANNYANQFELPVLFYVVCLVAQMTNSVDLLFLVLAWIFVASRVVHAYIHVTFNLVPLRGGVYGIGYFVVVIMTAILLFRLLLPLSA